MGSRGSFSSFAPPVQRMSSYSDLLQAQIDRLMAEVSPHPCVCVCVREREREAYIVIPLNLRILLLSCAQVQYMEENESNRYGLDPDLPAVVA